MDATYRKLLTYSYNIVGSYEDAKDLVQSTMEKYITLDKRHIEHEVNYLIKTVINASINFKNRAEKQKGYGVPPRDYCSMYTRYSCATLNMPLRQSITSQQYVFIRTAHCIIAMYWRSPPTARLAIFSPL